MSTTVLSSILCWLTVVFQLVVLLHGAAATRKSFALQIEALKVHPLGQKGVSICLRLTREQSDYRLVVPDLPGHGSRDNQQFTMQAGTCSIFLPSVASVDSRLFSQRWT